MYVIYVNDRPLTLLAKNDPRTRARAEQYQREPTHLTAIYSGKPRTLLNYADMLEKGSPKVLAVDLLADDLEKLWEDFRSHYRWLPAAGGVVQHEASGKFLFIFRRGYWDLPKGKIDAGEEIVAAATREVAEETGLKTVKLGEPLPTTYHTYRNRKEKRILKPTYWFRMTTNQDTLVPETAEDIERAEWRDVSDFKDEALPMYQSLREVLAML